MKLIKKTMQVGLISLPLMVMGIASAQADSHGGNISDTAGNMQMQHDGGNQQGQKLQRLTKKLNLTTDQQQAISAKLTPIRAKKQQYMSQIRASKQQIMQMMMQGNFDNSKISQLAKQQGDTMAQLTVLRAQMKQAIFSSLTADQQKAYLAMMKNRYNKMQQMKQGNPGKKGHW